MSFEILFPFGLGSGQRGGAPTPKSPVSRRICRDSRADLPRFTGASAQKPGGAARNLSGAARFLVVEIGLYLGLGLLRGFQWPGRGPRGREVAGARCSVHTALTAGREGFCFACLGNLFFLQSPRGLISIGGIMSYDDYDEEIG